MSWSNPIDCTGLAVWIPTSGVAAYQETYDIPGSTTGHGGITAPASGQPIGQIACPAGPGGIGAFTAGQYAGGTDQPLLSLDPSSARAMLRFGSGAHTNSAIRVNDSNRAFNFVHQGGAFTFGFWVYITSNPSSAAVLFGTTDATSPDAGFTVTMGTTGNIGISAWDGTQQVLSYSGAATTRPALNKLCFITMTCPGFGGSAKVTIVTNNVTDGTVIGTQLSSSSLAGTPDATHNAFGNLTLGVNCNTTNDGTAKPFIGYLGDLVILNGVATTDLASMKGYLPGLSTAQNTSGTLVRTFGSTLGGGLNPQDIGMAFRHLDCSNESAQQTYQDSVDIPLTPANGGVTAAVANGDNVGTIKDRLPALMGLPDFCTQRDARSQTAGGAVGNALPKLATNAFKGTKSALLFAGTASTNNRLAISTGEQVGTSNIGEAEHVTGDVTVYLTAKNTVNGDNVGGHQQGSQFIGSSIGGVTMYGPGYGTPNECILLFANTPGLVTPISVNVTLPFPLGWNTVVFRKNATSVYVYLPDGAGGVAVTGPVTLTEAIYMGLDYIGYSSATENAAGYLWKTGVYAADIGDTLAKALLIGLQNGGKAAPAVSGVSPALTVYEMAGII